MFKGSLVEQIKCRWREFRREPSAFFWVVFMPIIWMLALGFAFSDPKPEVYGVGFNLESKDRISSEWLDQLRDSAEVRLYEAEEGRLATLLQRGEIALYFQKAAGQENIQYFYDPANPEAQRARNRIDDILQRAAGREDVVLVQNESITAAGSRYVDFLIPGLLGLSIMTSSLFGIGMTIVSNRKENLLKRYIATPMRPYEYILSHMVGRGFILVAEFVAVMATGFLIFGFKIYGNFFSYLLISILGAAAFTAIALLCASRTKSIPMISGVTNLITLPSIMLSGVFFSKNNFPDWLRSFTDFLPLTALNDGLRKIALEGAQLADLSFEITVLIAFWIVAAVISQLRFRWY